MEPARFSSRKNVIRLKHPSSPQVTSARTAGQSPESAAGGRSREKGGQSQARFNSASRGPANRAPSPGIRSSSVSRIEPRAPQWSVQRHPGNPGATRVSAEPTPAPACVCPGQPAEPRLQLPADTKEGVTLQTFPDKSYIGTNMREISSGDFTQDVDHPGTFYRLRPDPCYSRNESKIDYTSQVSRSGLIYNELPYSGGFTKNCRTQEITSQDISNMDISKRNPRPVHLVKTSEPNVRTITDVPKDRKLTTDAMQHSPRNTIQAHVTDCSNCEKNTIDVDCERRRPTSYCNNRTFVGLTNPGNNCCVNALLQTLFMTPEYRSLLLRCREKGVLKKGNNHIPYHLYKVFQYLQDTTQRSVTPVKFIQCLMLNHIPVGIQLDAEEIFRSLFRLIRDQLKETEFVNDIKNLYIINTEEYTKCLKCKQDFKQDAYMLTLPLSLYNPSSGELFKCINHSLDAFFQPQLLDAGNKCYCDQCGEKTTTIQGYRVRSLPQILCLQLKRFELATNLGKAVKTYDSMAFPESLHLDHFHEEHHRPMNKYNLLSVIVHIGSASFGHYYAYIRSFPEMDWYCFRDEYVTKATWEDVKRTFGSSCSSSHGLNGFEMGGTAYLLFYKRVNSDDGVVL